MLFFLAPPRGCGGGDLLGGEVMVNEQGEFFPEEVVLEPTIAMARGEAFVSQCAWCGALLCASREVKLGLCPACGVDDGWWEQMLPVGPFNLRSHDDEAE